MLQFFIKFSNMTHNLLTKLVDRAAITWYLMYRVTGRVSLSELHGKINLNR